MICLDYNSYQNPFNSYQAEAAKKNAKQAKQDQIAYSPAIPIRKKISKSIAPLMKASLKQYQEQKLFAQAVKKG